MSQKRQRHFMDKSCPILVLRHATAARQVNVLKRIHARAQSFAMALVARCEVRFRKNASALLNQRQYILSVSYRQWCN